MALMPTLIDRYLGRAIAANMLGTLVVTLMVLCLEELMRLVTVLARSGGPTFLIFRMLVDLLPEYLRLAIPIGLFLGILLAFQKLVRTSELDILGAIGLGPARLLRVPFVFALATFGISVLLVGFIGPVAAYDFERQGFALDTGALGASVKVGEFNHLGPGLVVRVEHSEHQGQALGDVFVTWDRPDGRSLTLTAPEGTFLASRASGERLLHLTGGRLVEVSAAGQRRAMTFSAFDVPVELPNGSGFRNRGTVYGELTVTELAHHIARADSSPVTRRAAIAELNGRICEMLLVAILPMLAVALAMQPSAASLRLLAGLLLVVGYYKINQYAVSAGAEGMIDPIFAPWACFALFALLAARLYYVASQVPGGEPLGLLFQLVDRIEGIARKLMAGRLSSRRS